jgi:hypothetical protein
MARNHEVIILNHQVALSEPEMFKYFVCLWERLNRI